MKLITYGLFGLIVAITLGITYWAARRTNSTSEFYAAGGNLNGVQNGFAIAGDYMSAASFLGIAGLIALNGYDGFLYSVGWLVAYISVLLIVAEPLRNSGKYTMADVLAYRLKPKPVRTAAALSTLTISTVYLIAQMVGAGSLIQLLMGIPYEWAIIIVGTMMVLYVAFGGMLATTWVQIVKAGLLMTGATMMGIMVMWKFNFNVVDFFQVISNKYGQDFLEPGKLYKNPIETISLGLALVLGTAGMPHILMRFYTVPTAKVARQSVIWAMVLIGAFYILTTFLGFGAAAFMTPEFIKSFDKGGNMAAPLLAQFLGGGAGTVGGEAMLSFIVAVAFATILAVVAGLTLAASSAFAHDFYVNVLKGGRVDEASQLKVARMATFGVGAAAIALGLLSKGQNVAHLVALAFAVASAANVPVVVFSVFWKKFNTAGAVTGIIVGLVSSIGLVAVSPNYFPPEQALFPLKNPGIVSIPLGFLAAYVGALLFPDKEAESKFDELYVRANTGIGAEN
ncbi:solute symporter family protein [Heliophilum fasciatum]|uniref:Cation/acetate symporter n=1 Tax=Heliophilum fasciatum TaxID=35700 RepID=A0A4R2RIZ5_9FIRM|nr:sodium/solute symporter [Heliophilum fasciatum]MCW2278798.1 cation/acetate symporter [Heliophilum fasciatum]TCP62469.1 cation/acetate symporter [Heliophilum fasciatum]